MKRLCTTAVLLLGMAAVTVAQEPLKGPPRPGEGIVEGYIGTAVWPGVLAPKFKVFSGEGYTVHLVPRSDASKEIQRPGGVWFIVPQDRYRIWLEGRGKISPDNETLLVFSREAAGPKDHGLPAVTPVVAAGTVKVEVPPAKGEAFEVRLISLPSTVETPPGAGRTVGLFERRARPAAAGAGVLMPAGQALVAWYDTAQRRYLTLSRPVTVPAGGTVTATPGPPAAGRAHLLVRLSREIPVDSDKDDVEVVFVPSSGGRPRPPDLILRGGRALWGVWYDLRPMAGSVEAISRAAWTDPIPVRLAEGTISVVRGRLHAAS